MSNKKISISEAVAKLISENFQFFKDDDDTLYFQVGNDVQEATEEKLSEKICVLFPEYYQGIISKRKANDYAYYYSLLYQQTDEHRSVVHRSFYEKEDRYILYDINENICIGITAKDFKLYQKSKISTVAFLRSKTDKNQVEPNLTVLSVEECKAIMLRLEEFISVNASDLKMLIVYLITCFISSIKHPLLIITGEAGSSKTTSTKLLKKIVDPASLDVITFPNELSELEFSLSNHYFIAFDNLSENAVKKNISELLCCAVTGANAIRRELFKNRDENILKFNNIVLLNGISPNVSRPDLLQRALIINTQPISDEKRLSEECLYKNFDLYLPNLLGAIFNILSKYLARKDKYNITGLKRMADFEKAAIIISDIVFNDCESENSFANLYERKYQEGQETAVEFDPFVSAIQSFIEANGDVEGKPSEVFNTIKAANRTSYVFSSPNVLTKRLNDKKAMLASIGIGFESRHLKERFLRIYAKDERYAKKPKKQQKSLEDLLDLSDDDDI